MASDPSRDNSPRPWWKEVIIEASGNLLTAGLVAFAAILVGVLHGVSLLNVVFIFAVAFLFLYMIAFGIVLGTPREVRIYLRWHRFTTRNRHRFRDWRNR